MTNGHHQGPPPEELFDELSRINNELVNAQRELARQKAMLQSQHERLKSIIEALPHAHLVLDSTDAVLFANHVATDLLGDQNIRRGGIFPLPDADAQGAEVDLGDDSYPLKAEIYVTPIDWKDRSCRLVTVIDVTQKHRAQEEIRRKEKLQGVLEMAGAAAHNLAQPLQALISGMDLLLEQAALDEFKATTGSINESLDELTKLVQSIRSITKYELTDYSGDQRIIDIHKSSS